LKCSAASGQYENPPFSAYVSFGRLRTCPRQTIVSNGSKRSPHGGLMSASLGARLFPPNDSTYRCSIELLETGGWIAAITSLALGNIEIDQAVVSAIADMIAAVNVTLGRMTPTSCSISPAGISLAPFV
jgi:hypothetical protein